MLRIEIPGRDLYDESTSTFVSVKPEFLQLEHSLVSLSKWESKWRIPFLTKDNKTHEETMDYIKCMTITQNVDPKVYVGLPNETFQEVLSYIDAPMTATWFSDKQNTPPSREAVTAEIIYYWMISYNIPFECQKWHLNKLLTLIRVCGIKSQAPKKQPRGETLKQRAALNAARRSQLNTKG